MVFFVSAYFFTKLQVDLCCSSVKWKKKAKEKHEIYSLLLSKEASLLVEARNYLGGWGGQPNLLNSQTTLDSFRAAANFLLFYKHNISQYGPILKAPLDEVNITLWIKKGFTNLGEADVKEANIDDDWLSSVSSVVESFVDSTAVT